MKGHHDANPGLDGEFDSDMVRTLAFGLSLRLGGLALGGSAEDSSSG